MSCFATLIPGTRLRSAGGGDRFTPRAADAIIPSRRAVGPARLARVEYGNAAAGAAALSGVLPPRRFDEVT